MKEYKGYYIEFNIYGQNEYSVQYCGDDVLHDTEAAAKAFIDSVTDPETITDAEPEQLTLKAIFSTDPFTGKEYYHGFQPVKAPETPETITAEEVPAEDEKAPETATDEATTGIYYSVNEETARRGWESIHMSDYKPGSATADYRAHVDEVREIAEKQKKRVSPYYHSKIDALVDRYSRKLAQWFDDYNRNSASCPSWFIAGPANYPTKKHNRQMAREDSLWKEYNEIQSIKDKIKGVGTGPIDLSDPHAREMLEERLTNLQAELERDKALNAYYRKHKTFIGFPDLSPEKAEEITRNFEETRARCPWITKIAPDYELTSLRDKIKRTQERLEELNRREAAKEEGPAESETFNGGEIVRNIELDRLQIVFDDKPDEETRARLKENGFRWSPKNNAWQRQLTENAERALKRLALA